MPANPATAIETPVVRIERLATSTPRLDEVLSALAQGAARLSRRLVNWSEPQSDQSSAHQTVDGATNASGDVQAALDIVANQIFVDALVAAPVSQIASEEADDPIAVATGARFAVAIDPLDGSSNIAINGSVGTIFSVIDATEDRVERPFFGDGSGIVASGLVMYGPRTMLVLAVEGRVGVWRLVPNGDRFELIDDAVQIPAPPIADANDGPTPELEYAVNSSNARHWSPSIQHYIAELVAGSDGPRGIETNTRWVAAVVADVYRILRRGGVYLYPADQRPNYRRGRLRLLYEGHPIAYLIEAAGGAATDGEHRLLDIVVTDLHEHTPLVFGNAAEVARIREYMVAPPASSPSHPLFQSRGMLRG